jgi:tetratricopeptide (TPR) repeat protein
LSPEQGLAALERGDFDAARRAAEALIARSPGDADALVLAGRVAAAGLYLGAALDYFERAVLADPKSPAGYAQLARLYARGGGTGPARDLLDLALARVEPSAANLMALASAFAEFDAPRAVSLYERAIDMDPASGQARFGRVAALLRAGKLEAARAIADATASASDAHSLNLRAMVAEAAGDDAAAQRLLEQGAREHPHERNFAYNLHAIKARHGLWDVAERQLDEVLARFPGHADFEFAKASFLLRRGQFAEGFAAFEARRRMPDFPATAHAPVPRWDGSELRGRRILVVDEQGLGDSMMFVRFLPALLERGAAVRYLCRQPLYSLYAGQPAFTHIAVLPQGAGGATHQGCDCYATLLSLPHLLGVRDPGRKPYLAPPADLADEWRARIPRDGRPRVGVVWSANLNNPIGADKSMTLQSVAPLLRTENVAFFSLQLGGSEALKEFPGVTDLASGIVDFADTAAILANLDLLVSVDTAAAHLAGAVGTPVLVMAQADVDWRWGSDAQGRPYWYDAAQVVRQPRAGDWAPVIEAAAAEVKKKRRP